MLINKSKYKYLIIMLIYILSYINMFDIFFFFNRYDAIWMKTRTIYNQKLNNYQKRGFFINFDDFETCYRKRNFELDNMISLIFEMSIRETKDTLIGSLRNKDYNNNDSNCKFRYIYNFRNINKNILLILYNIINII